VTRSETPSELTHLQLLRSQSIALDQRFDKWKDSRSPVFKPTRIGRIDRCDDELDIPVGYWPGTVDTYFDLYVAGVWNIFRAARLLLVALIISLSEATGDDRGYVDYAVIGNRIAADMIASIPYHLVDNLPAFISDLAKQREIAEAGRYLGGLLLIHPLYVASRMQFLPDEMQCYSRRCLAWIGSNMGFGQATLLAEVRDLGAAGSCTNVDRMRN
jgi:hypothetical protein